MLIPDIAFRKMISIDNVNDKIELSPLPYLDKDPITKCRHLLLVNQLIDYCPILSSDQLPATVRVLVVDTVFRDNQPTDEKVAALIDVKIDR